MGDGNSTRYPHRSNFVGGHSSRGERNEGRGRGGIGGGGSSQSVVGIHSTEDLEGSTVYNSNVQRPSPSNIHLSDIFKLDDDANLMIMEEEKYHPGKSECVLHLKRAWVVQSAWKSIENVCKISSSLLVNKLQCEHIVDHFNVIAEVLKKLGLGKDFVFDRALEGGSNIQTQLTFDEEHFSHIVKTFEDHMHSLENIENYDRELEDFKLGSQIQDTSSMFEDYVCELLALDGSREESLPKQSMISEAFQDFSLLGMSMKKNVEARSRDCKHSRLDEFLCLLFGILKQGEDLVLFHSGLKVADNGVVERTGLYGEKFIEIHKLLYNLLYFHYCLEYCEGTKFARGYLSQHDACGAQSLLYYLNSNCLEEYASQDSEDYVLNVELAITLSELLERPNCVLKTLSIQGSSLFKINQVELQTFQNCHLRVIAALSKCMSVTSLIVSGLNGIEVHELCKSLAINKVLENLVVLTDEPCTDDNTKEVCAMLEDNHILKSLTLKSGNVSPKGMAVFGSMLAENSSLEELKLQVLDLDKIDMQDLIRPLMANMDGEPQVNFSLKHLHIDIIDGYLPGVGEIIAQLLHTNKTLTHFSINSLDLDPGATCKILDSLKINQVLQILNLGKCVGLDDPRVKGAFLDLLVNYNFTLKTIKMHGRDWDIEDFMKFELELDTERAKKRLKSLVGGISEFSIVHSAYDLKQALEDFQLEKGEGSSIEMHGSIVKAFEEHKEELVVGCPSKPKEIFGLKCKLERKSEQCLQELEPLFESISKSTNFLLRRNLNMAQFLQQRYIENWNSFGEMYLSELTNEEKNEFSKGCITAALFPTTFLYHLKARFLEGPNVGGILQMLTEVAGLVVQKMKSLQDAGSETFQFIDYVDVRALLKVQHLYSSVEIIAMCQTFSTGTGILGNFPEENSIVQDHLTGAYYFESDKSSNLDKPNLDKPIGVIGVKVTATDIQVEIMWEDGSCYSGPLEDFSYDLKLDNNKQCAHEAFGDLKGAYFLKNRGLKCSPLLVIALAMAIHRKGLSLTWSNGKGHIQSDELFWLLQPMESEVLEGQIIFGGDIKQLGDAIEWGMNEINLECASSSGDNQCQVILEEDPNQAFPNSKDEYLDSWSSDESYDISNHAPNNVDLVALATQRNALATQINAGAQDKVKVSAGLKIMGSGGEGGGEIKNSKGKIVQGQAYEKIQDLHWKDVGGYAVVRNLNDEHQSLVERLFLGFLCTLDVNYLVVYDDYKESHVSIYCVKERNHEARLQLKWITDIFIKGGQERIKKIFQGLKGETLEVTRKYTKYLEKPLRQQSKGYLKWFKNHLSNNNSCKDNVLQMVSVFEGPNPMVSNDEWEHIVGPQPYQPNKFWWTASYMKAITYSRTIYSSGILLSTHTIEKYGLKCGRVRRNVPCNALKFVHDTEDVTSFAKFSKAPEALSIKWHGSIYWGGFR